MAEVVQSPVPAQDGAHDIHRVRRAARPAGFTVDAGLDRLPTGTVGKPSGQVMALALCGMKENTTMGFNGELKALVDEVANRVGRWTMQAAWTFEPGSPASTEVVNTEMRLDGTPWGDRPVRTAYAYAQMATKLAAEFSRCAALLIGADRPAPGIEDGDTVVAGGRLGGLVAAGTGANGPAARLPDAATAPQQRP